MLTARLRPLRAFALLAFALVVFVACGSESGSEFNGGGGLGDGGGGGASSSGASGTVFNPTTQDSGTTGPESTSCKPRTCKEQGIECGPAGDGCGNLIPDCGACPSGTRCGGPGTPSKCVSPSIGTACIAKTCTEQNILCGPAGDGCGNLLVCPSCGATEQCGANGKPSQCVTITPTSPDGGACTPKTCAQYKLENKDCGKQSDGCGGIVDCGECTGAGEFCGGGGPSKCAVSGGGTCTPKTCADFVGKCGTQSDGCGGTIGPCTTCTFPAICGGGGVPSVCGGGSLTGADGGTCTPITVCASGQCGQIADGCGGILDCGSTCPTGQVCGGLGVANQCGAPPCPRLTQCPAGANCGSIADNCGGLVTCGGACTGPAICGGGGAPNVCGGGGITADGGPGGGPCIPKTTAACPANGCGFIADGCGGTVQCGTCTSPAVCGGGGTANVCGGGNQCTPKTQTQACGTMTCGFAPDGCGGSFACGVNAGACPSGQSCGIFAPNECGSLSGPCIATGSTTTCVSNNQCCSNSCGATGRCLANACKDVAVACTSNNECCSGRCGTNGTGTCQQPNGTNCKASGSTCGANSECCSGGCIGGKCSAATSYCKQTGDACMSQFECCGGACTGATATRAGVCALVDAPGGGIGCFIAGTVTQLTNNVCSTTSPTDFVCNTGCCTGSCSGHDAATGFAICQRTGSCSVKGELCTKDSDCCSYPASGSLLCGKPNGAGPNDYGRCSGDNGCNKPGSVCKTELDSCSFSNTCCPPPGESQSYCSSNPNNCCRHDNLGVPRCTGAAVCRSASQACETSADCCPILGPNAPNCGANGLCPTGLRCDFGLNKCGVVPPCTDPTGGTNTVCAPSTCIATNGVCSVDADCCGGNCFIQTPGATTGLCKVPTCTKKTCADYLNKCGPNGNQPCCGVMSDGCGDVTANCGTCTSPQTCGGGGVANVCGGTLCTPATCPSLAANGLQCGNLPDGCGAVLTCSCPAGTGTCGGGGAAYKCGTPTCNGNSCTSLGFNCGSAGDGCGNVLQCGTCPTNQTCGGGGTPNRCGAPPCTPITQCPAGKNCGVYPNGCGGSISCGADCTGSQTCGGGGSANVCGAAACTKQLCPAIGAQCGIASDGCGGTQDCGPCGPNEFCNSQNLCVGLACVPKTCTQLGVQCGPTADTCGGVVDCGGCPAGQGCGAAGVPGQCGTQACTPKSCNDLGAVCGQVADGCGSLTPSCGTCSGNLSCKNGACVSACTPITCASVGANCGFIADGCGASLDCGQCPTGEECGYGGKANVCGRYEPK